MSHCSLKDLSAKGQRNHGIPESSGHEGALAVNYYNLMLNSGSTLSSDQVAQGLARSHLASLQRWNTMDHFQCIIIVRTIFFHYIHLESPLFQSVIIVLSSCHVPL